MTILDQIGIECGTDKASPSHDYLQFYERFIGDWRDRELSILEIGVGDGPSLRMWEQYFHNAKIVGLDIEEQKMRWASPRSAVEIGDQGDPEVLERLAAKHGPFDIIVDDGGHATVQQITSLRTLLPHLKSPGFYFLEDIVFDDMRDHIQSICGAIAHDSRPFTQGDEVVLENCQFVAIMRGLFVVGK